MKGVKCNAGNRARGPSQIELLLGPKWSVRMEKRVREGISNITLPRKILQTDGDGG